MGMEYQATLPRTEGGVLIDLECVHVASVLACTNRFTPLSDLFRGSHFLPFLDTPYNCNAVCWLQECVDCTVGLPARPGYPLTTPTLVRRLRSVSGQAWAGLLNMTPAYVHF